MTKLVFIIWIDLDSCEFYSSVFSQFNTEDFIFVSIFLDSGFALVKEEVKESTTLIFYKFDYAFHIIYSVFPIVHRLRLISDHSPPSSLCSDGVTGKLPINWSYIFSRRIIIIFHPLLEFCFDSPGSLTFPGSYITKKIPNNHLS